MTQVLRVASHWAWCLNGFTNRRVTPIDSVGTAHAQIVTLAGDDRFPLDGKRVRMVSNSRMWISSMGGT